MTLTKPFDHPETGVPALDAAVVAGRVRELEEQLARERARCAGLEQGIAALTETIAGLRARLDEPA
jgi:hypothetical protein